MTHIVYEQWKTTRLLMLIYTSLIRASGLLAPFNSDKQLEFNFQHLRLTTEINMTFWNGKSHLVLTGLI